MTNHPPPWDDPALPLLVTAWQHILEKEHRSWPLTKQEQALKSNRTPLVVLAEMKASRYGSTIF